MALSHLTNRPQLNSGCNLLLGLEVDLMEAAPVWRLDPMSLLHSSQSLNGWMEIIHSSQTTTQVRWLTIAATTALNTSASGVI